MSAPRDQTRNRILGNRPRPNTVLIKGRINLGCSPNQLARRAGVHGKTVRSAEAGHYVEPRVQRALAEALGMTVLDLFPMERQRPVAGASS